MLRRRGPAAAPASDAPSGRRVLSVCEDVEAALRLTRYLAGLPGETLREDLPLLEAVARLQDSLAPEVDLVVLAPAGDSAALRPAAQTLVDLATHRAGRLVVLLGPGQEPGVTLAPSAEVEVIDLARAEQPAGLLAGLRRRGWRPWRKPAPVAQPAAPGPGPLDGRPLRLVSVQSLAGGAGGTTIASLLAAEIAARHPALSVLLIDLDLQFGQVGTYLDQREEGRITDLYGGFASLDQEAFRACLVPLANNLQLLAAPPEILPQDAIDARKVPNFLSLARGAADLVVLDLPHGVSDWMAPIWREADLMVMVGANDLRASHNFRRLRALTDGRDLTPGRAEVWLNRLATRPGRDALEELARLERAFGELTVRQLPEGGPAIREAQLQGLAPRDAAAGSALVTALAAEVRRIAPRLQPSGQSAGQGAAQMAGQLLGQTAAPAAPPRPEAAPAAAAPLLPQ